MKLVSTTLAGSNAAIIGDALRSVVDLVDLCLVIDTGIEDETLDVAREVCGPKLVVRRFPWCNDFSLARNFALHEASKLGADWAFTLDTDERIVLRGDLRAALEASAAPVAVMSAQNGTYGKERAFRLPIAQRWRGGTHEYFPSYECGRTILTCATFDELPKSLDASKVKHARDLEILKKSIESDPKNPRWFFYLGETLKNMGQTAEAILAYAKCASMKGWDEEGAWACFQGASLLTAAESHAQAVEMCAIGLSRHAGYSELAWLAAVASMRLALPGQAVFWANTALSIEASWKTVLEGAPHLRRVGFRNVSGTREGPYDVLRFALDAIGDPLGAARASETFTLLTKGSSDAAAAVRKARNRRVAPLVHREVGKR